MGWSTDINPTKTGWYFCTVEDIFLSLIAGTQRRRLLKILTKFLVVIFDEV
nr:MAG TPA: hypothetical protein [Caudoviricetes sp.]